MFCSRCQYPLRGLTRDTCPECGTSFDRTDPSTYVRTRRRLWPAWTWVMIAFVGSCFLFHFAASYFDDYRMGQLAPLNRLVFASIEAAINGVMYAGLYFPFALGAAVAVEYALKKCKRERFR